MLYFVIYAPISIITLVLVQVLIADLRVMSQVIGERMKLRAQNIKRSCKRSPIGLIQGIQNKTCRLKSAPKHNVREASGPDRLEATAGCPWGSPRPVVPDARSCVLGGPPQPEFLRFLRGCSAFDGFCCFSL